MIITEVNLKKLRVEYLRFLESNENVGCPMLSTALAKLIGGRACTGRFDGDRHCWVETKTYRADLNNLLGEDIFLILSEPGAESYEGTTEYTTPLDMALDLGLMKRQFEKWTERFEIAMRTPPESPVTLVGKEDS
jgi:hypothetical protein